MVKRVVRLTRLPSHGLHVADEAVCILPQRAGGLLNHFPVRRRTGVERGQRRVVLHPSNCSVSLLRLYRDLSHFSPLFGTGSRRL